MLHATLQQLKQWNGPLLNQCHREQLSSPYVAADRDTCSSQVNCNGMVTYGRWYETAAVHTGLIMLM